MIFILSRFNFLKYIFVLIPRQIRSATTCKMPCYPNNYCYFLTWKAVFIYNYHVVWEGLLRFVMDYTGTERLCHPCQYCQAYCHPTPRWRITVSNEGTVSQSPGAQIARTFIYPAFTFYRIQDDEDYNAWK